MPHLKLYKVWEVRDLATGKLIKYERKVCRSFTVNFMYHLEYLMGHPYGTAPDTITMTDTGGSARALSLGTTTTSNTMASEAPAGTTTYGLLVGTGTTAPTINDTAMQTLITHGTTSGKLSYGAGTVGATRVVDTSAKCLSSRTFTNNSGGNITVRESGLVVETATYYFMVIHEAENQTINNGQAGTLSYDFSVTN